MASLAILPLPAQEAPQGGPPATTGARDVVTEEALKKTVRSGKKLGDLMADKTLPLPATRPSVENTLYARSVILFDGEMHTVVPLGSILHLPPAHRQKIISQPQGDFTFWPAFLERNASWLDGKEVPLSMAQGDQTSAQKVLREAAVDQRVLVSVYKRCPISILEPVPENTAGEGSPGRPSATKPKEETR